MRFSAEFVIKFWSRFVRDERTGCLIWQGAKGGGGYGKVGYKGRLLTTSRVAWMLKHGKIRRKLHVLHRCDNPPCGEEAHLFLGTQKDNWKDSHVKGRDSSPPRHVGEAHWLAKLTVAKVEEARRRRSAGEGVKVIAADLGVTGADISAVCHGRSWKSAPGPITQSRRSPLLARVGEANGRAKLTLNEVTKIRQGYAAALKKRGVKAHLGRKYGVSARMIGYIVAGESWREVA